MNIHTVTYTVNTNHTSIIATDIRESQFVQTFSKGDIMEFEVNASKVFFYIEHIYSFSACNTILIVGLMWNFNQWEKEKELYLNYDTKWEKISFDVKLPWNAKNELEKIVQKNNYSPYSSYNPIQPRSQEDIFKQFKTTVSQSKISLQIKLQECTMTYNKEDYMSIQTSRQKENFKIIDFKLDNNYMMVSGYFNNSTQSWKTNELDIIFIDIKNNNGTILNQQGKNIGTILPDKTKCVETNKLIYKGKSDEKDEIIYMKKAFESLENNNELVAKIKNGRKINDTTLQLDENRCIRSIQVDEQGKHNLDLYQTASKEYIGPKILDYYTVYKDKSSDLTRQYLITEYLTPIDFNYDFDSIKLLASKIANSTLRFHPYFHYKMLGKDKDNNLKVMFWDVSKLYKKLNTLVMQDFNSRKDSMLKTFRRIHGGKKTKSRRKTKKIH